MPTAQGSVKLFRFAGIDVFLHWSWFAIAALEVSTRSRTYSSLVWNVLEYLALFLIVLMHEFGHSLACRQVGGKAERIILWPLGGVAYVAPPQRPGAMLWSIAAGPLVNVVLAPVLVFGLLLTHTAGWESTMPNASQLITAICYINFIILCFNLLPIYPLDGGQIFRSLLWFVFGRARSLMIASITGFMGVACLVGVAAVYQSIWIGIMAVFILLNCWRGLMQARLLARVDRLPRREGFACPECKQPPARGAYWRCARCMQQCDIFEARAACPSCGAQFSLIPCLDCGTARPVAEWLVSPPIVPGQQDM